MNNVFQNLPSPRSRTNSPPLSASAFGFGLRFAVDSHSLAMLLDLPFSRLPLLALGKGMHIRLCCLLLWLLLLGLPLGLLLLLHVGHCSLIGWGATMWVTPAGRTHPSYRH